MPTYLIDDSNALMGPVELPVIPGLGEQMPSNAISFADVLDKPASGFSWALINNEPKQLKDCRGLMYRTDSGAQEMWSTLGEPPETLTSKQWPGSYHVWREGEWVFDKDAERLALDAAARLVRDQRLIEVATRIAPLQYAKDLGIATEVEESDLIGWKRYSVELNRIEQASNYPFQIVWPALPSEGLS